jgi:periplasmic protein TonB
VLAGPEDIHIEFQKNGGSRMFDQLESLGEQAKTRKPLTVVASLVMHVVIGATLLIIPLVFPETLSESMQQLTFLVAPPPPPPPPPPAPTAATPKQVKRVVEAGTFRARVEIPKGIKMVVDDGPPPDTAVGGIVGGVPGGVPGGEIGGVIGGVIGGAPTSVAPPPPPPPPAAPKPPQRVRIGGNVQQANLIREVQPSYPLLAKQARIQGAVVLEAIINEQGSVENLRIINGHPLLTQAALDAVKQWKYKPTVINGEPVEVVTKVTVNFHLSG